MIQSVHSREQQGPKLRCSVCGAVDGSKYARWRGDRFKGQIVCSIDSESRRCDREACVRARAIPDVATNEQRRNDPNASVFDPSSEQLVRWKNRPARRVEVYPGVVVSHSASLNETDPHLSTALRINRHSFDENMKRLRGQPSGVSKTTLSVMVDATLATAAVPRESISTETPQGFLLFINEDGNFGEAVRERQAAFESLPHLRRPIRLQKLTALAPTASNTPYRPSKWQTAEWESNLKTAMLLDWRDEYAKAKKIYDEINVESLKLALTDPAARDWEIKFRAFIHDLGKKATAKYPGPPPASCLWRAQFLQFGESLLPSKPRFIEENWGKQRDAVNATAASYKEGMAVYNDDEESPKRGEPGTHLIHDGQRETAKPAQRDVANHRVLFDAGEYEGDQGFENFKEDSIILEIDFSNISEQHAGEFAGKKGNTMSKAKSRRLDEIAKDVARTTGAGRDKIVLAALDRLFPKGSKHKDGFYLLVQFPQTPPRLYPLDVISEYNAATDESEYDPDDMEKAIHDLRFRIARGIVYKTKSTGDYDRDVKLGEDIYHRVWGVFAQAKLYCFSFRPSEQQAA